MIEDVQYYQKIREELDKNGKKNILLIQVIIPDKDFNAWSITELVPDVTPELLKNAFEDAGINMKVSFTSVQDK